MDVRIRNIRLFLIVNEGMYKVFKGFRERCRCVGALDYACKMLIAILISTAVGVLASIAAWTSPVIVLAYLLNVWVFVPEATAGERE